MFSIPLAYLITFHTHGTWLHGDDRGSVDPQHNVYGLPRVAPDPGLVRRDASNLDGEPVVLDAPCRTVVERTIIEVCSHHGWPLHGAQARTNHVHIVVTAPVPPERAMNALKSWCTRRVVVAGLRAPGTKLWTRHGSTRYLWKPEHVASAVDYVLNRQGAALPRSPES